MSTSPDLASVFRHPADAIAFGFGLGLLPRAPGTFGTLLGVALHLLTMHLPLLVRAAGVLALFLIGIWACGVSSRRLGVHDHAGIVWDEVVGYLLTMLVAPPGWLPALVGFLLFRLFDIWKPWPIRLADRQVHGGFGIMLDDALAGLAAAAMLGAAMQTGIL